MEFDLNKRHCFYFYETTKIPHGSRNEKALSDYVVEFAKAHGLRYKQDHVYNVIIYKDASKGYEDAEPLILQAHLDMVCEKNKDSDHDFEKDPLKLIVKDGILKADGTTLGADDCTGVAYMLAILEDDTLPHPPLECIFTTMEEIGLLGSMELKAEDLHAHRMISLDGGGEDCTMLTSAGGCRVDLTKELKWEENQDACYKIAVRGLAGGHSGGEIHKEKGNANTLMARIMKELQIGGVDVQLVSISGGLKENAIPRECDVMIASSSERKAVREALLKSAKAIKTELEFSDEHFYVEFFDAPVSSKKMSKACSDAIIDYIYLMPNGFQHRSMAIEGLTLTSLNLGVVESDEHQILLRTSLRSALESGIEHLVRVLSTLAKHFDFTMSTSARYPGWNYSVNSPMRDTFAKVVKEIYGTELRLIAAHGGCECGVFKGLVPDMDIISVGPNSAYIHTPDEQLDLASFDRAYHLLCSIIAECH